MKESQRTEEVITRQTRREKNKVKDSEEREERELGEMRRMPLCVIVRTNWHLGSLIRRQALN